MKTRRRNLIEAGIPEEELALIGSKSELAHETLGLASLDLLASFTWNDTKQGHDYWDCWHEKLIEREEGHE